AEQTKQSAFEGSIMMPDLGFKVFKLADSNFKQWRKIKGSNKGEWQQQLIEFVDPIAETATTQNMIYELLLKSGKDLNSVIVKKDGYYTVNGNELVLILETVSQEIIDTVLAEHPDKVIALDRLFMGNDPLKTNTALQMHDADIDFKTI
ncbi:MAG: site-specific DNA-methyltransferase, partial [Prevotella sp.]|nr:site-specific DNA-methyltransferase [Prevotella sp.]